MDLVERAKNIIVTPKTEWTAIEAEPSSVQEIYSTYVMLLAAIPAVVGFLVSAFFGLNIFALLLAAVVNYLVGLVMVYVLGLVIDALAPTFGGTKNPLSAFKVAAYSPTPIWVASIVLLIPLVGFLVFLVAGIYTLFVLYLGLSRLMHVPDDKSVAYTAAVVVAGIVIGIIISFIISPISPRGFF